MNKSAIEEVRDMLLVDPNIDKTDFEKDAEEKIHQMMEWHRKRFYPDYNSLILH